MLICSLWSILLRYLLVWLLLFLHLIIVIHVWYQECFVGLEGPENWVGCCVADLKKRLWSSSFLKRSLFHGKEGRISADLQRVWWWDEWLKVMQYNIESNIHNCGVFLCIIPWNYSPTFHHVVLPCFYSDPEQTIQTLAPRVLHISCGLLAIVGKGLVRGIQLVHYLTRLYSDCLKKARPPTPPPKKVCC